LFQEKTMSRPATTITVHARKPRNPFVAACRMRRAGRHRGNDPRQQSQRDLRREIDRLRTHSP
jgi:hypothetical protein